MAPLLANARLQGSAKFANAPPSGLQGGQMPRSRPVISPLPPACSAGVFFERAICLRKRHVETSRREEEMGRVKGSGAREEKTPYFFFSPPLPLPLSFFRPRTYRKGCEGYYFYSPQSSTFIKSKMAATTILRTRTMVRPPKIRLHCRL